MRLPLLVTGMLCVRVTIREAVSHALDRLPYPLVMRVLRCLECGSHAAAPAVLRARRVSCG